MNYLKNIPFLSEAACASDSGALAELLKTTAAKFGIKSMADLKNAYERDLAVQIHARYYEGLIKITRRHRKEGVQWVVPSGLVSELAQVDLDGLTFEDVPWPATSIEFFFEDKDTPTILLQVKIKGLNLDQPKSELFLMYYPHPLKDDPQAVAVEEDELQQFFRTGTTDYLKMVTDAVPGKLDVHQSAAYLVSCLKLLLLAGTPQYAPQKVNRKELAHGGRAGVNNRPKRPVYRFLTLPHIVGLSERSEGHFGVSVVPHFRRGHFRMLRNERYTQKRGQIVYVRPSLIHGGADDMPSYHLKETQP